MMGPGIRAKEVKKTHGLKKQDTIPLMPKNKHGRENESIERNVGRSSGGREKERMNSGIKRRGKTYSKVMNCGRAFRKPLTSNYGNKEGEAADLKKKAKKDSGIASIWDGEKGWERF